MLFLFWSTFLSFSFLPFCLFAFYLIGLYYFLFPFPPFSSLLSADLINWHSTLDMAEEEDVFSQWVKVMM